jgi:hypothetical protein
MGCVASVSYLSDLETSDTSSTDHKVGVVLTLLGSAGTVVVSQILVELEIVLQASVMSRVGGILASSACNKENRKQRERRCQIILAGIKP